VVKIDQKIVGQFVITEDQKETLVLNEKTQRPDELNGRTYKLKTPLSESALYVTINNYEVNGQLRPFEVFINSKDMSHFQWVIALTRVMSAVFRKGGEVNFLIDELKSVHDPKGGYFDKGRYVTSLVSAIGDVVETHLTSLGLYVKDTSMQQVALEMVTEKMSKLKDAPVNDGFPENATMCSKCNHRSVVIMDNCSTCLNCSDSKCG
jgi:hypothetical protein